MQRVCNYVCNNVQHITQKKKRIKTLSFSLHITFIFHNVKNFTWGLLAIIAITLIIYESILTLLVLRDLCIVPAAYAEVILAEKNKFQLVLRPANKIAPGIRSEIFSEKK